MAISASASWEIRTTGSDQNGGLYVSTGTDYSQQDSAQLTVTDGVTNGTTTVTSATGGFTTAMIGNGINVAGTVRQITARTDTNTITVDATIGAASGQTMKVGGACVSPGFVAGFMTAGNVCWIKAGTYNISSATANISGGKINFTVQDGATQFRGYGSTRGDLVAGSTRPVLKATTGLSSYIMILAGRRSSVWDIEFDGNSQTSTRGLQLNENYTFAIRCYAHHCALRGITQSYSLCYSYQCEVSNCTGSDSAYACDGGGVVAFAYSHDNTAYGFYAGGGTQFLFCVSARNTIAGYYFNSGVFAINCVGYSNQNGVAFTTNAFVVNMVNCVMTDHSQYGFGAPITAANTRLVNCAGYNNTSGNVHANHTNSTGFITLTAGPFTNTGTSDFTLNSTSGGGAALRAAGYGVIAGLSAAGYPDIGAYQSRGGGIVRVGFSGGFDE